MMMKHLSCKVLVLLLLAGCITATPVPAEAGGVFKWYNPMTWTGGDDDAKESSKKLPQKQESEQPALKPVNAQPKQEPVPSRAVQRDTKEDMVGAVLETEKGNITIQLYPKDAPETVENFKELVEDNFYNVPGMKFHRVVEGFVVQTGDPTGTGYGGSDKKIPLEVKNKLSHDAAGVVAMARGPLPNSASSQFYITLAEQKQLDGKYAVFGRVIQGLSVVQSIQKDDKLYGVKLIDISGIEPEVDPNKQGTFNKIFGSF